MSSLANYAEVPAAAGRKCAAILLYVLGFICFTWLAARYADLPNNFLSFATGECGAAIAIVWVWTFSAGPATNARIFPLIYSGVLVDLVFNTLAARLFHGLKGDATDVAAAFRNLPADAMMGVGNIGLLTAAIGLGLLVGRGLQKPNYLLMACLVGAVTDIFDIFLHGPGQNEMSPRIFPYVSFQWGVTNFGGLQPIVGAGDWIFLALYFFGTRKFGLDDRRTLAAMILAIGVGFAAAMYYGIVVPALPFFAIALLLVHGRALYRQYLDLREGEPCPTENAIG